MSNQRDFNVIGQNLITMANMLLANSNLCKLLYYTSNNPLIEDDLENPEILITKNIIYVPKIPDFENVKGSFLVLLFDDFNVNGENEEFLDSVVRIDVICPIDEWATSNNLRPFSIMKEVKSMINGCRLNGVGTLKFVGAERVVLSPYYAGYSMVFVNNEFN